MSSKPQGDRNVRIKRKTHFRGLLLGQALQPQAVWATACIHISGLLKVATAYATISLILPDSSESCKLEMADTPFYFVVLRERMC